MADCIAIITGPRTGAGHLLRLSANFDAVRAEPDLMAGNPQDIPGKLDLANLETSGSGKRVLVIKLTSAISDDIIARDILSRPGMRALIVIRRQIDTYVSLAKATALDTWRGFDTTSVKVKLDASRFARWMEAESAWYSHWRDWLAARAMAAPVLRYETHIDAPPETTLRRFTSSAALLGIALSMPETLTSPGLVKQDRSRIIAEKVRNWPEFSRALSEMGLEKRAFAYPI